jgi:hypothetical protein
MLQEDRIALAASGMMDVFMRKRPCGRRKIAQLVAVYLISAPSTFSVQAWPWSPHQLGSLGDVAGL